jgi:hypothetical protein
LHIYGGGHMHYEEEWEENEDWDKEEDENEYWRGMA